MIKAAVLTATRAEYGLMRQLIFKLDKDEEIELNLLVAGTHLSAAFGMTVNEIKKDGIPIAGQIDTLVESDGIVNVGATMGKTVAEFNRYFAENKYDFLLVDGDRYETLMVCIAAINHQIPIVHCGGGATTAGALDDYWRHAITKLSFLHFPSMERYRKRIIAMGENPAHVFAVGSLGIDNIIEMKLAEKFQVEDRLGFHLDMPYALVTFHPATAVELDIREQIQILLDVCDRIKDMKFVFTKANADENGYIINELLEEYVREHAETSVCVDSLGAYYYLSAMKYCELVLGNSSSGLIEAPSFEKPTVNVGDRQKGRERASCVIDCEVTAESIYASIEKARSVEFKSRCLGVINPNGDGKASSRIIGILKDIYHKEGFSSGKTFWS